ncbi:unnamed protein product [Ectocarpus sp. 6 AP-2014]
MCGILGIFGSELSEKDLRSKLIECSKMLRHRGPDWSGYEIVSVSEKRKHGIGHERLSIIDPESGAQPLFSRDGQVILSANGEIYNYQELLSDEEPLTGSDCESIIPLYMKKGADFLNDLRGMFAFFIYDKRDDSFFVARDHVGIIPLYIGWGDDGSVWISSEMKALVQGCRSLRAFPPGHSYSSKTGDFTQWYNPVWRTLKEHPTQRVDLARLRESFTTAVVRRMMTDVPWGVLLSGGLDSSLVASVACRHVRDHPDSGRFSAFPRIHSFSVGLAGSPDIKAAKEVADFLGTVHHSYVYTVQEGLDAIREVVRMIETYDTTTIRASTPMFLMSRKIKAMGVKMVLSGEGADELLGGYLYFHKAPNGQEFFEETRDKVLALHQFDCARANKSTASWGVEARVPFLDVDFIEEAMMTNPEDKMVAPGKIEKYIMRKAFDTPEDVYLPQHILYRQKEQFSDGVGYNWIDELRAKAAEEVTDEQFKHRANRFPRDPPATKEAYLYRKIFEEFFPTPAAAETVPMGKSIACSTARALEWDESFKNRADCSGRAIGGVHDDAYGDEFEVGADGAKKATGVAHATEA